MNRYLDDGRLEIDNNGVERQIRSIAVGRKNWLFTGSDDGGKRAATLYSVIGTCALHGVEVAATLPRRQRVWRRPTLIDASAVVVRTGRLQHPPIRTRTSPAAFPDRTAFTL